MKTKNLLIIIILLMIGINLLMNSCSLIGIGIGAAADGSKPKEYSIGANHVNKIKNKSKVIIHKKDGTQINGKFVGTSQIAQQDYAEEYEKFKKNNHNKRSKFFPDIGDSLMIIFKDANLEFYGLFLGFDYDQIIYSDLTGDRIFNIIYDTSYTSILYKEKYLDYIYIKELIYYGRIPTLLAINLLVNDTSTLFIPANDIDKIISKNKRNAKFKGLGIGLVIDAIIFVIVMSSMPIISFE